MSKETYIFRWQLWISHDVNFTRWCLNIAGKLFYCNTTRVQGWKKYRTTGPFGPRKFLLSQKIFVIRRTHRQTDRQKDKKRKQKDRQTETKRKMNRRTDRQTGWLTDRKLWSMDFNFQCSHMTWSHRVMISIIKILVYLNNVNPHSKIIV